MMVNSGPKSRFLIPNSLVSPHYHFLFMVLSCNIKLKTLKLKKIFQVLIYIALENYLNFLILSYLIYEIRITVISIPRDGLKMI